MANKLYTSKAWLTKRYYKDKKTPEEIGRECGVSHMTIRRWIEKFGL